MAKLVYSSPTLKVSDGIDAGFERIGPSADLLVSQLNGRLFELSRIGNLFYACNQSATAVSVALTATCTGLILSNPAGNSRDLVVQAFSWKFSVAQVAVATLGIQGGWSAAGVVTHTTPLAFGTAFATLNLGSPAAPTALVDSAATTVNPRLLLPLGGAFTAGSLGADTPSFIDLHGGIIIQPGGWVAAYALTAATGFGGIWWSEQVRG